MNRESLAKIPGSYEYLTIASSARMARPHAHRRSPDLDTTESSPVSPSVPMPISSPITLSSTPTSNPVSSSDHGGASHSSATDMNDFELAVDAAAIDDSSSLTDFGLQLNGPLITTPSSSVAVDSDNAHVDQLSGATTSIFHDNVKSDPLNPGPTHLKASPPCRPPPFRPRTQAPMVAASDIHALLDSFPSSSSPPRETISNDNSGLHDSVPVPNKQFESTSPIAAGSNAPAATPIRTPSLDRQLRPRSRSASRCSNNYPVSSPPSSATHYPVLTQMDKTRSSRRHTTNSSKRLKVHHSSDQSVFTIGFKCTVGAVVVLLLASMYYLSTFVLGIAIGVACTLAYKWLQDFLWSSRLRSDVPRCRISGLPLGELCCSLHCHPDSRPGSQPYWPVYAPALPPLRSGPSLLRDLQSFPVPHMNDEDPSSSAATGPLGSSLGFKLDSSDHPVYRGWMNEAVSYDPETHHVNHTRSVFVTLDGAQLRLQRPKRNVARRAMWNEELPSTSTCRFHTQRLFDLTHAQVVLLPSGLVCKRLWSKKYPISITFASDSDETKFATSTQPNLLHTSISTPNMTTMQQRSNSDGFDSPATKRPSHMRESSPDDSFVTVSMESTHVVLFLFGRTCREKETWYRRFHAASLGVPLLWTPQLAVKTHLSSSPPRNPTASGESRSDDDTRPDAATSSTTTATATDNGDTSQLGYPAHPTQTSSREPLYVTYVRYMAKVMPASWLVRGAQTLRLNVNHIACDPSLCWLNALLARILWDFLREAYWLERVRDKIQAKLKKIHLPGFISDLIVVGIELGSELPIIRHIGRPYLDAHGLWLELDIAYAGGFSVALETNVNLLRWNQRNRIEWEAANLADDVSNDQTSSVSILMEPVPTRRSSRMGAFVSDEEDSTDSTTDSDTAPEPRLGALHSQRRSSASSRNSSLASAIAIPGAKGPDEERSGSVESPFQLASALPTRKRFIRIMDRITKSSYFQKAVDNKLVQRGMEMLSNTPIVLEAEVQSLTGTLLVNIPPPPSDRLWYGFRPNPQLRIKARPRVGEKAVTMSRILEWIENRVTLEFQRLVVLPNMDDISIPLLLSDVVAGGTK